MEKCKELIKEDDAGCVDLEMCIYNKVYTIREKPVMLDYDLAQIYGYEVKRLNEQVKRNIVRFPEDFMFQLNREETEYLRSQFATANINSKSRTLPFAFTEQGIYMLATVLKGKVAEQQSIFIMRAFREMRHYIKQNQQFVNQSEMRLVTAKVSEMSVRFSGLENRQKKTEQDVESIQKRIDAINENFISDRDFKNFVIYKGQKFEADAAYIHIYQQATSSIYVVDDYVNTKTLQLLSQKKEGVEVILFSENGHGRKGFLTSAVINDFKEQYPTFRMKSNPNCHDRWIVLDYNKKTEQVYHCGASSKDAGKRLCAINKVENTQVIHQVIDELLVGEDKGIEDIVS